MEVLDLLLERPRHRVGEHPQVVALREFVDARVPAGFGRIVAMRDDERHLDAAVEERRQAADAYVAVAEDDRSGCHVSAGLFSRTAWIR
jgi:hypothetical protein